MTTLCDSVCVQIRRRNEHEQNQTIRFQSAKFALKGESRRLSGSYDGWHRSRIGENQSGIFFALNPSGGKQSAQGQNRYRRLATLGHARTATLTDQQEMENDNSLTSSPLPSIRSGHRVDAQKMTQNPVRVENLGSCGFPFLSHFRSGCSKRVREPKGYASSFPWGASFVFCSFFPF